jgi:hypothetical protein
VVYNTTHNSNISTKHVIELLSFSSVLSLFFSPLPSFPVFIVHFHIIILILLFSLVTPHYNYCWFIFLHCLTLSFCSPPCMLHHHLKTMYLLVMNNRSNVQLDICVLNVALCGWYKTASSCIFTELVNGLEAHGCALTQNGYRDPILYTSGLLFEWRRMTQNK